MKRALEAAQKYIDETPREVIEAEIEKVKALGIEGPTFDEYMETITKLKKEGLL